MKRDRFGPARRTGRFEVPFLRRGPSLLSSREAEGADYAHDLPKASGRSDEMYRLAAANSVSQITVPPPGGSEPYVQTKRDALGPECAAIEQRGGLGGPDQYARTGRAEDG